MGLTAEEALGAAEAYTRASLNGVGALKGVPCQIQSIEDVSGGSRVTYLWEDKDGVEHTSVMIVLNGERGPQGIQGPQGVQGAVGPKGDTGAQGIQGIQGVAGAKGDKGDKGDQGIQGIQGIQGEKGDDGYPFLIYKQYDDISEFNASDFPEVGLLFMVMTPEYDPETGDLLGYPIYRYTGAGTPPYSFVVYMNTQGIKGEKGDKGDTGAQGIQGEKGDKGDKGDTGEQGAQGIQGIQGIQGEPGEGVPTGGTVGQVLMKSSSTDYDAAWESLGSASLKNATSEVRPNSHDLVDSNAVYSAINGALAAVYVPHGDLHCADLTSALLIAENVGNVYQMLDSGTTSELFINGTGITINANDSVGIIRAGQNTILFNYMGNVLDLHDYQKKDLTTPITVGGTQQTTVEGALGGLNTTKATIHNVSIQGTSVIEDDIQSLINDIISQGVGVYAGGFARTGKGLTGSYILAYKIDNGYNNVSGFVATTAYALPYSVGYSLLPDGSAGAGLTIKELTTEISVSLVPVNNSTIYSERSRVIGGVVTIAADIIVQSGSHLTKENAVANVPNLGAPSVSYLLPCLYRNTGSGIEEPNYAIIGTSGNLYPYQTKTEYNEIRINASYSSS